LKNVRLDATKSNACYVVLVDCSHNNVIKYDDIGLGAQSASLKLSYLGDWIGWVSPIMM